MTQVNSKPSFEDFMGSDLIPAKPSFEEFMGKDLIPSQEKKADPSTDPFADLLQDVDNSGGTTYGGNAKIDAVQTVKEIPGALEAAPIGVAQGIVGIDKGAVDIGGGFLDLFGYKQHPEMNNVSNKLGQFLDTSNKMIENDSSPGASTGAAIGRIGVITAAGAAAVPFAVTDTLLASMVKGGLNSLISTPAFTESETGQLPSISQEAASVGLGVAIPGGVSAMFPRTEAVKHLVKQDMLNSITGKMDEVTGGLQHAVDKDLPITSGMASGDPGLLRVERRARIQDPAAFAQIDKQNHEQLMQMFVGFDKVPQDEKLMELAHMADPEKDSLMNGRIAQLRSALAGDKAAYEQVTNDLIADGKLDNIIKQSGLTHQEIHAGGNDKFEISSHISDLLKDEEKGITTFKNNLYEESLKQYGGDIAVAPDEVPNFVTSLVHEGGTPDIVEGDIKAAESAIGTKFLPVLDKDGNQLDGPDVTLGWLNKVMPRLDGYINNLYTGSGAVAKNVQRAQTVGKLRDYLDDLRNTTVQTEMQTNPEFAAATASAHDFYKQEYLTRVAKVDIGNQTVNSSFRDFQTMMRNGNNNPESDLGHFFTGNDEEGKKIKEVLNFIKPSTKTLGVLGSQKSVNPEAIQSLVDNISDGGYRGSTGTYPAQLFDKFKDSLPKDEFGNSGNDLYRFNSSKGLPTLDQNDMWKLQKYSSVRKDFEKGGVNENYPRGYSQEKDTDILAPDVEEKGFDEELRHKYMRQTKFDLPDKLKKLNLDNKPALEIDDIIKDYNSPENFDMSEVIKNYKKWLEKPENIPDNIKMSRFGDRPVKFVEPSAPSGFSLINNASSPIAQARFDNTKLQFVRYGLRDLQSKSQGNITEQSVDRWMTTHAGAMRQIPELKTVMLNLKNKLKVSGSIEAKSNALDAALEEQSSKIKEYNNSIFSKFVHADRSNTQSVFDDLVNSPAAVGEFYTHLLIKDPTGAAAQGFKDTFQHWIKKKYLPSSTLPTGQTASAAFSKRLDNAADPLYKIIGESGMYTPKEIEAWRNFATASTKINKSFPEMGSAVKGAQTATDVAPQLDDLAQASLLSLSHLAPNMLKVMGKAVASKLGTRTNELYSEIAQRAMTDPAYALQLLQTEANPTASRIYNILQVVGRTEAASHFELSKAVKDLSAPIPIKDLSHVPSNFIEYLKNHPNSPKVKEDFDLKYGPGSANQILHTNRIMP